MVIMLQTEIIEASSKGMLQQEKPLGPHFLPFILFYFFISNENFINPFFSSCMMKAEGEVKCCL